MEMEQVGQVGHGIATALVSQQRHKKIHISLCIRSLTRILTRHILDSQGRKVLSFRQRRLIR